MEYLDGKIVKQQILEDLKKEVEGLDRKPGLVVIQVGEDPASVVYVRQKAKMAENVGFYYEHVKLPEDVTQEELEAKVIEINNDERVDGLLVQMPLPKHIDAKKVQNLIDKDKDVDGLSDINAGRLSHNVDCLVPCTPKGIMDILAHYNIEVSGKNVVVVGRSDLVGKPMSYLMTNANATVTLCHSRTEDLKSFTERADILVAAIGKPNFITGDMIKENAVLIDVGINRVDDKLIGDIEEASVKDKASYLTPVPGGVGQMTVAELGKNTLKAYKLRNAK